ncbi:MAG: AraC family transcriptional regulator [Paenibacillaceae bacterium]|jgi:AraC-like DNA-binding protein|nr:AraC family transcriptional regulator [Paenibacillaceae bacterium]
MILNRFQGKRGIPLPIFGFYFTDGPPIRPANLHAVGQRKEALPSFRVNGLERKINHDLYIFQYTLSGEGRIRIGQTYYPLHPGTAFLVKAPGDHQYELPQGSTHWESIYIALSGKELDVAWDQLTNRLGVTPHFHEESTLIYLLKKIYRQAENKQITDGFQAASLAYQFLTELYRVANRRQESPVDWPDTVVKATEYIAAHYATIRSLDDIAAAVGLSRFHFNRLFHRTTGITPIQYLTKIRLDRAMEMLKNEALTLDEIADKVGLSTGNYLSRTFRKTIGMSPGQFRSRHNYLPLDHITFD